MQQKINQVNYETNYQYFPSKHILNESYFNCASNFEKGLGPVKT